MVLRVGSKSARHCGDVIASLSLSIASVCSGSQMNFLSLRANACSGFAI